MIIVIALLLLFGIPSLYRPDQFEDCRDNANYRIINGSRQKIRQQGIRGGTYRRDYLPSLKALYRIIFHAVSLTALRASHTVPL